jgi:hypothetical protein
MPMTSYGYTWRGGPLLSWKHGPPFQSKAGDTQALGSLGGSTLEGSTLYGSTILPAPGAPEPIGVSNQRMRQALGGCSCSGSCGCGTPAPALSGTTDLVGIAGFALAGYLAWRVYKDLIRK